MKIDKVRLLAFIFALIFGIVFLVGLHMVNALSWNSTFEDGLVSYWGLNINSNDNFGINNLQEIGSPIHLSNGCINAGCYNFTGTNYLTNASASAGSLNYPLLNTNSTISFWWKTSNTNIQGAFSYGVDLAKKNRIIYSTADQVFIGSNGGSFGTSNTSMFDYNWHMITYIHKDSNAETLYLDGTSQGSAYTNQNTNAGDIFLGAGHTGGDLYNFTGEIDEVKVWNRTLTNSEVRDLYNNGNGIFKYSYISLNYPSNNFITTVFSTVTFNCSATSLNSNNNVTDLSAYLCDTNNVCNLMSTSTSRNSAYAESVNSILLNQTGTWKWYCNATFADASTINSQINTINTSYFIINSQTYNLMTTSGSIEPFVLNLSYANSQFTGISVQLNYNNTNYTSLYSLDSGGNSIFYNNITIPTVSSQTNKSFYYIIILSNSTGISYYNTTTNNQTINPFLVDNCGTYTKVLYNYTMLDEESLQKINGTINVLINLYTLGTSNLIGSYNNTFAYITSTSSAVCLNNITTGYNIAYQVQYYGNSSYYKRYKIVQLATITNTTIGQNINLYDVTTSATPFKITVVGSPLPNQNAGLLVEAQKQYLNLNQYIPVEDTQTGNDGNGALSLIQNSAIYNFIVSYNGQILGSFNSYKAVCQNPAIPQCTITLNLASISGNITDYRNYGNVAASFVYNNLTNSTLFSYFTTGGNIHTVREVVTVDDGYGNTTICDQTGTGTSGTLICFIPIQYQSVNLWSTVYVDGVFVGNSYLSLLATISWFGVDVLIELLMFSCLVMLFLEHPVMIVIGAALGFIMSILLLWASSGSFSAIVGVSLFYVAMGGLVLWQISRKI
jgi:hypothetical protein